MRTIHWQITFACNLRCSYCWNLARDTPRRLLAADRVRAALDEIAELGTDQVLFTGGEPLLVKEMLEYVERGLRRGIPISLFSNGTSLTVPTIEALMAIARHGPFCLVVSLDAADPKVNAVTRDGNEAVLQALERLQALGATRAFKVMVNSVITARNIDHVEALLELTARRGVREHRLDLGIVYPREVYYPACRDLDLAALPADELAGKLDHLERVLEAHRDRLKLLPPAYYQSIRSYLLEGRVELSCQASERLLVIDPEGRVRPCFGRDEILADLTHEPFAIAHRAAESEALRQEIARQSCISPRCLCSFIQFAHHC